MSGYDTRKGSRDANVSAHSGVKAVVAKGHLTALSVKVLRAEQIRNLASVFAGITRLAMGQIKLR